MRATADLRRRILNRTRPGRRRRSGLRRAVARVRRRRGRLLRDGHRRRRRGASRRSPRAGTVVAGVDDESVRAAFDDGTARLQHVGRGRRREPAGLRLRADAAARRHARPVLRRAGLRRTSRRIWRPGRSWCWSRPTYPGTTEELVKPLLETSGLAAGRDFLLAYSPERIDPGNAEFTFRQVPRVVGGLNPESTGVAVLFYEQLVDKVMPCRSCRAAELAKLLENTFRHVNIALANEMAMLCHEVEIDVWEVIDAAATKPFGFMPFYPGPGVGGHCIPLDPTLPRVADAARRRATSSGCSRRPRTSTRRCRRGWRAGSPRR